LMLNAFWWSTIISLFLATVVIILSKKEIRVLFK
jgi:hypothetical protein